jgi:hypothetical protein
MNHKKGAEGFHGIAIPKTTFTLPSILLNRKASPNSHSSRSSRSIAHEVNRVDMFVLFFITIITALLLLLSSPAVASKPLKS